MAGKKRVCLAITEADAGSDVKVSPASGPRRTDPTRPTPLTVPPLGRTCRAKPR